MKFWLLLVSLMVVEIYSEATVTKETQSAFATANNKFALGLLKKLHSDGTNIFFSPLSISAVVTMTSLGARGNTLDEIISAFHFNDVSETSTDSMAIHEAFKKLILDYQQRTEYIRLANKLFVKDNLDLLSQFLEDVQCYYNVSVEKVDFCCGEAEDIINQWVSEQTNNKINEFFAPGSIDPNAFLVLVNAIYFKDNWKYQFDSLDTKHEKFYINSNETNHVRMLIQTNQYSYTKDEEFNAQVLEMPYNSGNISLIAILPQLGEISNLISNLTAQKLHDIINSMTKTKVRVFFPKLTTKSEYSLETTLNQLGINELFTNSANLSGISELPAKVKRIKHKALLKVNEEGTEAVAVAGLEIMFMSMPYHPPVDYTEFRADHPFLFFIVDRSDEDIILFTGVVNSPEYKMV